VQKTLNDSAAVLQAEGSPGPVYFPPSPHPCKVDTLTFPNGFHGWLYVLFDNRLYANHINIGSFNAFEARSSGFRMGALFPFGPSVEWLQWQHPTNSGDFVGLYGVSEVYFKGIKIQEQYSQQPAVHMYDDNGRGSVSIKFESCESGGSTQPFAIDSSQFPKCRKGEKLKT